jgi:hypothetical protein
MEGGGSGAAAYAVRTPEEVFRDYRARRAAMIKALTTGTRASFPIGLLSSAAVWIRAIDGVSLALCRCGQVLQALRPR